MVDPLVRVEPAEFWTAMLGVVTTGGLEPVPERAIRNGFSLASLLPILRVEERVPVDVGLKRTLKVVLAPGVRVVLLRVVNEKLVRFPPSVASVSPVRFAEPVLIRRMVCHALEEP